MSNLVNLPEDIISHITGFLDPIDFYAVKTAVSSGLNVHQRDQINCYYWWREEMPIARAANAECASLIRWVAEHDAELDAGEIVAAAHHAHSVTALTSILDSCRLRYPSALPDLMCQWVELGRSDMFEIQIISVCRLTEDLFDAIYLHFEWRCLTLAFRYNTRDFIAWVFGEFMAPADPEVIVILRYVLQLQTPSERIILTRILNKYHEWLWRTKLDALPTIAAIHSLKLFIFKPIDYLKYALRSEQSEYLEYLILQGLEIEPDMIRQTASIDKMRLLMNAQVVQKYQKIMVLIFVLIAAVVMNMFAMQPRSTPLKLKQVTR